MNKKTICKWSNGSTNDLTVQQMI